MDALQPQAGELLSLPAMKTALWNTGKIHLVKADFAATPQTVLGDLTEADYDGYAEQAVATWGAPIIETDEHAYVASGLQTFVPTGTTTPNTIYGAYVTDKNDDLAAVVHFDDPIPLVSPTTALLLVIQMGMGRVLATVV